MANPLSMLLGPLAKLSGAKVPSAVELWQNRQRGPVGSPAWAAQHNTTASPDEKVKYSGATPNTPFGIQNSDPAYWQQPYRAVDQRHEQAWGAPVDGLLVESPYSGHTAEVPRGLQPQEPNSFAKLIGAPGVPSSSGFDSRGDSSIYANNKGRKEAVFQAAANPYKAVNVRDGNTTSFYQPGNEQVGTVNLTAPDASSQKPARDDTSLNEGQESGKGGK